MQAGHPDIDVIGHLFQNIQTQQFVGQITSHVQDYLDAKKHITERASILTLAEDFKKSVHGLAGQMKLFDAIIEILITRLGNGFAPVVNRVGRGLVQVEEGFQWLDQHVPGLSNKIIEFAGVGLLAVAALAAIGIAAPAVAAGFMLIVDAVVLLATPVGAVLAALGLLAEAAWDVYDSWADFAPFFGRIWQATQHFFAGFLRFVAGVFSLDLQAAYDGLTAIWDGLAGYWFNLWGVIGRLFTDFTSFVDGWTGGAMAQAISNIKHEWDGLKAFFFDLWGQIRAPFDAFIDDFENSSVGRLMGLSSAPSDMAGATDGRKGDESYALPRRDDSGYIEIRFANPPPGLEATGSNSRFRFQPLNPLLGPAVGIQ